MGKPSRELLVACSQLTGEEYANRWGGVPEVEAAILLAAKKRLTLARELAQSAAEMVGEVAQEIQGRNAISRSYYACHHAARALSLYRNRRDRHDHYDVIEYMADTADREAFLRQRLGGYEAAKRNLAELITRRHLADYYPYGVETAQEAAAGAEVDFVAMARESVAYAHTLVGAVEEFILWKEEES